MKAGPLLHVFRLLVQMESGPAHITATPACSHLVAGVCCGHGQVRQRDWGWGGGGREVDSGSIRMHQDPMPSFRTHMSSWTYTSYTVSVDPRRLISNQEAYTEVRENYFSLPLPSLPIGLPLLDAVHTQLVWLHHRQWWGIGLVCHCILVMKLHHSPWKIILLVLTWLLLVLIFLLSRHAKVQSLCPAEAWH